MIKFEFPGGEWKLHALPMPAQGPSRYSGFLTQPKDMDLETLTCSQVLRCEWECLSVDVGFWHD